MHKWLLFEMAKSPKPDERKAIPAEKGNRGGGPELAGGLGLTPKAAAPLVPCLLTSSSCGQPPFGGPWGEKARLKSQSNAWIPRGLVTPGLQGDHWGGGKIN